MHGSSVFHPTPLHVIMSSLFSMLYSLFPSFWTGCQFNDSDDNLSYDNQTSAFPLFVHHYGRFHNHSYYNYKDSNNTRKPIVSKSKTSTASTPILLQYLHGKLWSLAHVRVLSHPQECRRGGVGGSLRSFTQYYGPPVGQVDALLLACLGHAPLSLIRALWRVAPETWQRPDGMGTVLHQSIRFGADWMAVLFLMERLCVEWEWENEDKTRGDNVSRYQRRHPLSAVDFLSRTALYYVMERAWKEQPYTDIVLHVVESYVNARPEALDDRSDLLHQRRPLETLLVGPPPNSDMEVEMRVLAVLRVCLLDTKKRWKGIHGGDEDDSTPPYLQQLLSTAVLYRRSLSTLQLLLCAHPAALHKPVGALRELPLHLATTLHAPTHVLSLLLSDDNHSPGETITSPDSTGRTPLDWLWMRHVVDYHPSHHDASTEGGGGHRRRTRTTMRSRQRVTTTDDATSTTENNYHRYHEEEEEHNVDDADHIHQEDELDDSNESSYPVVHHHDSQWSAHSTESAIVPIISRRPAISHKFVMNLLDMERDIEDVIVEKRRQRQRKQISSLTTSLSPHNHNHNHNIYHNDNVAYLPPKLRSLYNRMSLLLRKQYLSSAKKSAATTSTQRHHPSFLPLHAAAAQPLCPPHVVRLFRAVHYDDHDDVCTDNDGNTALHLALGRHFGYRHSLSSSSSSSSSFDVTPFLRPYRAAAVRIYNQRGRLPLHVAIERLPGRLKDIKLENECLDNLTRYPTDEDSYCYHTTPTGILMDLVWAYPSSIECRDGVTGLYPFMQAAAVTPSFDDNDKNKKDDYRVQLRCLDVVYLLLRECPALVNIERS